MAQEASVPSMITNQLHEVEGGSPDLTGSPAMDSKEPPSEPVNHQLKPPTLKLDYQMAYEIYYSEARNTLMMLAGLGLAIGHLHCYEGFFGVKVMPPDEVPTKERYIFHHGWSAMLLVSTMEIISITFKIWSTAHHPVLACATAKKLEGNLGVMFGEYLVVGIGYLIMANNCMPVFVAPRSGRPIYGVRFMVWFVDSLGLIYLDCFCLFSQELKQFWKSYVFMFANVAFGLASALAVQWELHWLFLILSFLSVMVVVYLMIDIARRDPRPLHGFGKAPIKLAILAFLMTSWMFYGLIFLVAFQELVSAYTEQMMWTGMDMGMKIMHGVMLLAFRSSQWEIDAEVNRIKAEAYAEAYKKELFVAELDCERAINARDRAQMKEKWAKHALTVNLRQRVPSLGLGRVAEGSDDGKVETMSQKSDRSDSSNSVYSTHSHFF